MGRNKLQGAFKALWRALPLTPEQRFRLKMTLQRSTTSNCQLIPISLTSLGRSGSSVMLGHLGCHPEIAVYQLFSQEAHYIPYFAQCIDTLTSQESYLFPLKSGNETGIDLIVGKKEIAQAFEDGQDDLWFRQYYLPRVRALFSTALADYYQWRNQQNSSGSVRFMCEKFSPWSISTVKKVFPEMKEIVLVRDFRDVLCSIISFNERRGFNAFGMEMFPSIEEYITQCLAPSAESMLKRWKEVGNDAHLVRYEDFILDREVVLAKIMAYLGTDDQNIQTLMESADKLQGVHQKKQHQTSLDTVSSVGRYSTDLAPEMIALCNDVMKKPLLEFGYLEI